MNPIILSFSLKKVPTSESYPGFPRGPYGERGPLTGHFYISLDIPLYLKDPKKRASLHVPQKWGPYGNRGPFQSLNPLEH